MDHGQTAAANCGSGLAWRDCDSFPSGVDGSNDFSVTVANAPPVSLWIKIVLLKVFGITDLKGSNKMIGPSTKWTDEKHSLYLSSLEASFVNELHRYIGPHSCLRQIIWGRHSSRESPPNRCDSSHEVSDSHVNEPLLDSTADSGIIQRSPCVHHLASSNKRHAVASHEPWEHRNPFGNRIRVRMDSVVPDGLARSTEQQHMFCLFHQVVGSTAEASAQNFADE